MSNKRRTVPSVLELMREHARLAAELADNDLAQRILSSDPEIAAAAVAEYESRDSEEI